MNMLELKCTLQFVSVLTFWITLATTEGWKWRMNDGRPDNSSIMTGNSYHIWRSFTTASFLVTPMVFVSVQSFLVANLSAWLIYERWMSLEEHDDVLFKRGPFHLVGKIWIQRPDPILEIIASACGLALYVWICR